MARFLTRDLAVLAGLLPGRFDNSWQVKEDLKTGAESPHEHIQMTFKPINMPVLGERVFYVERYYVGSNPQGDQGQINAQRIYSFGLNLAAGAIELVVYSIADSAVGAEVQEDVRKLAGLHRDDLRSFAGCEIYWRREGEHFVASSSKGACRMESEVQVGTLLAEFSFRLSKDEISVEERLLTIDGAQVDGSQEGEPSRLRRARYYECWAAAAKEDPAADWDLWRPLVVHNQGDGAELIPEGRELGRYSFELSQAIYAGSDRAPSLELAVRERGQEAPIGLSSADPGSQQIGLNLRAVKVGCTRQP
jgi:hypothetical protein